MSKDPSDSRTFDVRMIERSIRRGLLTRKEVDKFHKTLPDVKDKSEPFSDNPYDEESEGDGGKD